MRKSNIALRLGLLGGLAFTAAVAFAQPAAQPLVVKMLKKNVYVAEGGGGNTGIIVGDKGVIVIDAKTTPASGMQVVDEVKKLTAKPITTVILTHSDADHVNGLAAFPKGLTIIAHANNKMEQEQAIAAGGRGAPPKDYLPTRLVTKTRESDTIDGVKLTLIHVAPAHTSGDLAVYLPDQKMVFTGDLVATTLPDPLIHLQKHGTSQGWIDFVSALAKLDADTYVPGHGDPQSKAQVETRLKNAETKRAEIASLVKQGKSLDEVKSALGETAPAGAGAPRFPSFTETTYEELAKK
jgi:glyoxylase-like metal-dependent hydrolase (beta-lactamase superfamily II)